MTIQITVSSETNETELMAIAALIAVLRGDATIRIPEERSHVEPAPTPAPAAPPPPAADAAPPASDPPVTDPPTSEALIQSEANRAAGAAATGELDANGIPWDARIHAGTKVKNADQSWRTKRGADPALVASVTAELKAAAQQPPAADAPPPPSEPAPAATAADAATAFGAAGAGGASDAPAPPAADVPSPPAADATPPPPAAPAAGELIYPAVLSRANEGGLDYDTLNAMAVAMGLEKFASLAKAPATTLRLFADTMEAKIAEAPAA